MQLRIQPLQTQYHVCLPEINALTHGPPTDVERDETHQTQHRTAEPYTLYAIDMQQPSPLRRYHYNQ